jgi:penicillin amidase
MACTLFRLPPPASLAERLAALPTTGLPLADQVLIHWDSHQIPFIEATSDGDAAFALGLVHAHLRLAQMEIYRHVAQGRIAEMAGPFAADIDHGLRILHFAQAVPETEALLPAPTRLWLARFVAGINHYQEVGSLPHEFPLLGLAREPWRIADILTFLRLSGSDVNWLVWTHLLILRERGDWPQIWARLLGDGSDVILHSSNHQNPAAGLFTLLGGLGRGSNSLALAPWRTRRKAAIIASDPHLGITLPNTWLLAGLKSPSYHLVGLMVPGVPVFALGRNPWLAWGGTNLRAASSDLVEVSDPDTPMRLRRERLGVRWWFDREIQVRETPWGPLLSDAPQMKGRKTPLLALRWTGHQPSDEITALLEASKARDFSSFRAAFRNFAVPGQHILYADAAGNIGQLMAVRLPARLPFPPDLLLDPVQAETNWARLRGTLDLPFSLNPAQGFLVSANHRPPADAEIPIGYFFSPEDRAARMAALLTGPEPLDVEAIQRLQQDVFMASSLALRDRFLQGLAPSLEEAAATSEEQEVIDLLRRWDGYYRSDSRGALAFELVRTAFLQAFPEAQFGTEDWAAFANVGRMQALLWEDLERAEPRRLAHWLRRSLQKAAARYGRYTHWGDLHRLRLAHPLASLPLLGSRYRFAEYPCGGSTDTLMKTAHGTQAARHYVQYGSNARHISDLSDLDRNYFVLLGGQDGWLNSSTFLDQVPLWRAGEYLQMPLRLAAVRARFPYRTTLYPGTP